MTLTVLSLASAAILFSAGFAIGAAYESQQSNDLLGVLTDELDFLYETREQPRSNADERDARPQPYDWSRELLELREERG